MKYKVKDRVIITNSLVDPSVDIETTLVRGKYSFKNKVIVKNILKNGDLGKPVNDGYQLTNSWNYNDVQQGGTILKIEGDRYLVGTDSCVGDELSDYPYSEEHYSNDWETSNNKYYTKYLKGCWVKEHNIVKERSDDWERNKIKGLEIKKEKLLTEVSHLTDLIESKKNNLELKEVV